MNISEALQILDNDSRFYMYQNLSTTLVYDAYVNYIYSFDTESFNIIRNLSNSATKADISNNSKLQVTLKTLAQIINNREFIPVEEVDNPKSIQIMINTSTICNLNCSYCYRDKSLNKQISEQQLEQTIELITQEIDKEEYVFSLAMTSESTIDYPIISKIINKYYCDSFYFFTEMDIKNISGLWYYINTHNFPNKNQLKNISLIEYLNVLIKDKKLVNKIKIPKIIHEKINSNSIPFNIASFSRRKDWRYSRMNRAILDFIFSPFLSSRKIPTVTFWFMSNGTRQSKEYFKLIKKCNISPFWISIDGSKDGHNINRQYNDKRGSFDDIRATCKKYKKEHIKLHASSVLNIYNYSPLEIISNIRKIGFDEISMAIVHSGSSVSFDMESIQKLKNEYELFFSVLIDKLKQKDYSLFVFLKNDMSIAFLRAILAKETITTRCPFYRQIVVDTDNSYYNCLYFCKKIFPETIKSIQKKDKQSSLVYNRGQCKSCWARYLCGGTCYYNSYVITGDLNKIDEVECYLRKYLIMKNIEVYGHILQYGIKEKIEKILL